MDLRGTGQLAGVRAIYSTGHALVWLEVDSANCRSSQAAGLSGGGSAAEILPTAEAKPAGDGTGSTGAGLAGRGAAADGLSPLPPTPAPSWAASGFDAVAFQRKAATLAAALAAPGRNVGDAERQHAQHAAQQQQGGPGQVGSIAQKAEEWCVHHHMSLAGRGEAPPVLAQP